MIWTCRRTGAVRSCFIHRLYPPELYALAVHLTECPVACLDVARKLAASNSLLLARDREMVVGTTFYTHPSRWQMSMLRAMHVMASAFRFWYFGSEKRVGVALMQLPPVEVYRLRMNTLTSVVEQSLKATRTPCQ
jgi:hypothetical protein